MRHPWLLALALAIPPTAALLADGPATEEKSANERLIDLASQDNRVMETLHYLVNVIGPRLTSSHNDHIACEWAREQLEKAGLENVKMEVADEFPVAFHRGPWSGKMLEPEVLVLEFGTPAWSAGTRGAVSGPAMLAPEKIEGADPAAYKGAWILMPTRAQRGGGDAAAGANAPTGGGPPGASAPAGGAPPAAGGAPAGGGAPPAGGAPAGGDAPAAGGAPVPGGDAAATPPAGAGGRRGAGGRMTREERQAQQEVRRFLEEAGVAGFITPTRNQYIVTAGSPQIEWEKLPTVPRINLLRDHFDKVMAHLGAGTPVKLQFDIRNHFEKGPAKFYNVYADIVGTEFPDQVVIIGGHIDSWDGATGTTDNGMGAATTLEAARLLAAAGAKPRRTIRFMLWSGEEQGLLGSRKYVEQNPQLLDKISAVLVYDGGPNAIASLPTTAAMHAQMEQAFAPVMNLRPEYPFVLKKQEKGLPRGIGSDHESFLPKGVPGFFWDQEGRADWRHGIHTQFDTYDLAIPEYLEHSTLVIALGALGIANLDGLLDRTGLSEEPAGGGGGRRMGVFLEELTVSGIVPDSVAAAAGLEENDVFVKVDGVVLADREALIRAIQEGPPKKTVVVKRGDKEVTVEMVWPDEKPAEPKKEPVVL